MTTNLILFSNFASNILIFIENLMILIKFFALCIITSFVLTIFEFNIKLLQIFGMSFFLIKLILSSGKTFDMTIYL